LRKSKRKKKRKRRKKKRKRKLRFDYKIIYHLSFHSSPIFFEEFLNGLSTISSSGFSNAISPQLLDFS